MSEMKRGSGDKKASKKAMKKVSAKKVVNPKKVSNPQSDRIYNDHNETCEDILSLDGEGLPECNGRLEISLSRSLMRQLGKQAAEEGVSVPELVNELLAEAVTLRAWEIIERKNQMRAQPLVSGNRSGNHNNNGGSNRNQRRGSGRGMSHGRYQNIMDDKASFLEYVRNQERNRR